ncbi:MAG: right-handed parallel beta-helix repeat-containing protein [Thermogutta sp.]|uniref:right-handed parallel beta-helix repeat-containing protein n=1 Tax=Thermogutta sp. TaxID=1962930 RepID=UPI0019850C37|nr:right-handed parallel beta-helix repeat-containing protein [Thermogutta sp.]MBC7353977.1 right-handed parallel beta-helix repeat-containing protein [Thermogutta sp.]
MWQHPCHRLVVPRITWTIVLLLNGVGHLVPSPVSNLQADQSELPIAATLFRAAPPLPAATEPVIRVRTVGELFKAVEHAKEGTTILLSPGRYVLPRRLDIRTDRVTLRGASGRRQDVILDGGPHQLGELLAIHGCSDVVIADLTIENVRWNGIKLDTDSGVHRVTIYNCILHNIWQRAVKGVRVPATVARPEGSRVMYCLFYNDRPKSYADDPADTPENFQGNYIGGIDIMFAAKWTISDNVFYNIQGRTREGRGAIFLWHDSRDCVVERNVIINCDMGIALGNSYKPPDVAVHAANIIVRNNFIVQCPESGIVADYTRDCVIAHNSIFDPDNRLGRLIRLVHDNQGTIVVNNLLVGSPVRNESTGGIRLIKNLILSPSPDLFVDPKRGDLHLRARRSAVCDAGSPLPLVIEDFDRQPRDSRPDIGADEWIEEDPFRKSN